MIALLWEGERLECEGMKFDNKDRIDLSTFGA